MKRIAIISLIAVFLTANYAYATMSLEELAYQIEPTQELTQEEAEILFVALLSAVDMESIDLEGINVCSALIRLAYACYALSIVFYPFFAGESVIFLALFILFC